MKIIDFQKRVKKVSDRKYFKVNMVFASAALLVFLMFVFSGDAAAGSSDDADKKSTRRAPQMLSTSVRNSMTKVREDFLAERYDDALEKLTKLLEREGRIKKYDMAKALEMLVSVYLALEHYAKAIETAEQALLLNVLEPVSTAHLHHRLVYLYIGSEHYEQAIMHINRWFELEESPDIQSYFTAAHIYALSNEMDLALSFANQGMAELLKQPDVAPKESWYQLLASIQLKLSLYPQAANTFEQVLSYWPDQVNYYLQLGGVYQALERGGESLAILSIAYQNELLTKEAHIDQLLQLYRHYDYPYKGAIIYQNEISQENIKRTEESWGRLANAWLQSREWEQAETTLISAAKLSRTGKHWLRLCQITLQDERWKSSASHCENALQKGGLEKEQGSAWYLLALGRYYQDKIQQANKAFKHCADWKKTQNDCMRWNAYTAQILKDREEQQKNMLNEREAEQARKQKMQEDIEKALLLKS